MEHMLFEACRTDVSEVLDGVTPEDCALFLAVIPAGTTVFRVTEDGRRIVLEDEVEVDVGEVCEMDGGVWGVHLCAT